jgi:hypothetical protein
LLNKFKLKLNLIKFLPIGLIFLLTSCIYSANYIATYTVQDKNTKEVSINFINQLADNNSLSKDNKYNGIDTLGFYGRPYHYFKFWFEQKDTNILVKLDYWGNFSSRKNKPYQEFFIELNDFMNNNFIIIEQNIKEENNSKK